MGPQQAWSLLQEILTMSRVEPLPPDARLSFLESAIEERAAGGRVYEGISKLDGTGFQPLISMSWRQTQGFALGWYEDALSALQPFIWLRF